MTRFNKNIRHIAGIHSPSLSGTPAQRLVSSRAAASEFSASIFVCMNSEKRVFDRPQRCNLTLSRNPGMVAPTIPVFASLVGMQPISMSNYAIFSKDAARYAFIVVLLIRFEQQHTTIYDAITHSDSLTNCTCNWTKPDYLRHDSQYQSGIGL